MKQQSSPIRLNSPLTSAQVEQLHAGDRVLISGVVYTARDVAHKRIVEMLELGKKPPFELEGAVVFYAGPSPARPGAVIGAIGPTTSGRMDPYTPALLKAGVRATIGKGKRSREVIDAMKKYRAVYLSAIGGVAALLAKSIESCETIAFPELGPEAVRKLVVKDFPAFVINDVDGRDLYEERASEYRE